MTEPRFECFIRYPKLHGAFDGFKILSVDVITAPRGTRMGDKVLLVRNTVGGWGYARHPHEAECRPVCKGHDEQELVRGVCERFTASAIAVRRMDGGAKRAVRFKARHGDTIRVSRDDKEILRQLPGAQLVHNTPVPQVPVIRQRAPSRA